jgi:hypothetical protein
VFGNNMLDASTATISSGLCRFLDINQSSTWREAITSGGPLLRGQTVGRAGVWHCDVESAEMT